MAIKDGFIAEVQQEAVATGRCWNVFLPKLRLEAARKIDHEKRLSVLVADMFGWFTFMIEEDELDFAKGYDQPDPKTIDDLVGVFDKKFAAGIESLKKADDPVFSER